MSGSTPSADVRSLLEHARGAGLFAGAVAGWRTASGGQRVVAVGTLGVRPPSATTRMVPGTWFDLASLTKPLVTTTLFLLASRHRLIDLDTRVGEVLPQAVGSPTGTISVRELLTHTAGLPSWAPLYAHAGGDPTRALGCLVQTPLEAPPGGRVVYSCVGFLLLGAMLETVFAVPLDRALRELVLDPLQLGQQVGFCPCPEGRLLAPGATTAGVERELLLERGLDDDLVPPLGAGLPDDGNARFLGGVAGNAGLFGSLQGVLELASEYLAPQNRLLAPAEVHLATRSWTPGLEQSRGLGWQLAATPGCSAGPSLAAASFGHTGFTGCSIWVEPELGAVLGLLCHRHHPAHRGVDLHPLRRRFHTLALAEIR